MDEAKRLRKIRIKAANAAQARGANRRDAKIAGQDALDKARKERDDA